MRRTHVALVAAGLALSACVARPAAGQGIGVPSPGAGGSAAGTASAPSLIDALESGTLSLGLRYRYELVDDDAFASNAHASTLRSSLGFRTAPYRGFFAGLSLENIAAVGEDDLFDNRGYGRLDNEVRDRPAVADPSLAEIDQAYLGFRGPYRLELRAGRMPYTLDNQRFIGTAPWRQNHRSFDLVSAAAEPVGGIRARYAFLARVHYNTGASPRLDGHLLHLHGDLGFGGLSGYAYLLDWRADERAALSSATFGLRFQGETPLPGADALYFAEYARQQDHGDNPHGFDHAYVHLGIGARAGVWTVQAAWEMKGGDGTHALQTPLGTNHGKNGFADRLVATPPVGSHDLYARLAVDRDRWSASLGLHRFRAVETDDVLGSELDFQGRFALRPGLDIAAKLAAYRADTLSTDVTKLMLWSSWSFDYPGDSP
jgi:hypothetical protein